MMPITELQREWVEAVDGESNNCPTGQPTHTAAFIVKLHFPFWSQAQYGFQYGTFIDRTER